MIDILIHRTGISFLLLHRTAVHPREMAAMDSVHVWSCNSGASQAPQLRSRLRRAVSSPEVVKTTSARHQSLVAKNFLRSESETQPDQKLKAVGKGELFELARQGNGSELVSALSTSWSKIGRQRTGAELDVDAILDERGNSLLHTACLYGHAEVAQVLVQLGASVSKHSSSETTFIPRYGATPATASLPQGRRHPTDFSPCASPGKMLSAASGEATLPSVVTVSYGGWSPLHYAAKSNSKKTLKWLLREALKRDRDIRGQLLNSKSADGSTPLHSALDMQVACSHQSCLEHSGESCTIYSASYQLRHLMACGADVNSTTLTRRRWCSLMGRPPAFVRSRLTSGLTPLHCAVDKGDITAVRLLVLSGCDVNIRTDNQGVCDGGLTSLHFACEHLLVDCVRVLLEAGADPNARDKYDTTPLHLSLMTSGDSLINSFGKYLHVTAEDTLAHLKENDCMAIGNARYDIVRMLLEAGADRHAIAWQRPTDDPCHADSSLATSSTMSLAADGGEAERKGRPRLILSDMCATENCLGGRRVLQLIGTCFIQPFSLRSLARRVVARDVCAPLQRKAKNNHYIDLIDKLVKQT